MQTKSHIHIGTGRCPACGHYGDDCTGVEAIRFRAESVLANVQRLQAQFWAEVHELETVIGEMRGDECELDCSKDYNDLDLEDVLAGHGEDSAETCDEENELCDDCRAKTPQAGLGAAPAEVSQAEESNHTLEDWPIIHSYTRAEAIDDGVLVDCEAFMWGPARIVDVVGFLYPVAMTATAYGAITDGCDMGTVQNKVALAACLRSLHSAIKASPPGGSDVHFEHEPLMVPGLFVKMWARCGPGDDAAPVVTIMLEGED